MFPEVTWQMPFLKLAKSTMTMRAATKRSSGMNRKILTKMKLPSDLPLRAVKNMAAGREGRVLFYADELHQIVKAAKKGDEDTIVISFIEDDLREEAKRSPRVLGKIISVMASLGWMNVSQIGSKAYEKEPVYSAAKALLSTLGEVTDFRPHLFEAVILQRGCRPLRGPWRG